MYNGSYASAAVVGALGYDIREVDTLAKHVPIDWCFRRCNTQSLTQNTSKVGSSRSVPEKLAIVILEFIPTILLPTVLFA